MANNNDLLIIFGAVALIIIISVFIGGVINGQEPSIPANAYICTESEKAAEICTLDWNPVCGNDGMTYGNACSACASGNIEYYVLGEC